MRSLFIQPRSQTRTALLRFLILGCVFSFGAAAPARAQQSEMDALAAQVVEIVHAEKRDFIVVVDFAGPQGNVTELGRLLAGQLSAALAKADPMLIVIARSRLMGILRDQNLLTHDLRQPEIAAAVGKLVGAQMLVTGEVGKKDQSFLVSLNVWNLPGEKKLAEKLGSLPANSAWEELLTKPVPGEEGSVFSQGKGGIGEVRCEHCPLPSYAPEARAKKIEGVVVLAVTITAQGRAKDFVVIRDPGYGLDHQAIAAVERWRFTPARGRDGKPVAARGMIEVNFRLVF